jgi:hypothetical protein
MFFQSSSRQTPPPAHRRSARMTAAMPIRLALAGNNAIVLACLE